MSGVRFGFCRCEARVASAIGRVARSRPITRLTARAAGASAISSTNA